MNANYLDRAFSEMLFADHIITPERLGTLLGERTNATESVGDMLVRVGVLSENDRIRLLSRQLGIPSVNLTHRELDPAVARLITGSMAMRLSALPLERSATALSVALTNPMDIQALDELKAYTGLEIDPVIASREDIQEAITQVFGAYDELENLVQAALSVQEDNDPRLSALEETEANPTLQELDRADNRSPLVRLVHEILARAITNRASDIHLNPEKETLRIRFRIDGMLQEVLQIRKSLQQSIISRLKIIAGMDIAERRAPQDGRLSLLTAQGEYDFRLSTYPSLHGENLVIRILDKKAARVHLDKTGMPSTIRERLETLIQRPYGMILVCGPTGSGKTTTLYACLNRLNAVERNIMTIEDPVEYQLPGIIQGNVNPKAGVTFASGLRSIVRQDPDILLVGEIRDVETARIAIEAALTGHLVLSSIHANDSAGAISRLMEMGVEPFLVASALVVTVTQRLIRLNCPRCSSPYTPPEGLLTALELPASDREWFGSLQHGKGCEACGQTGYRGRTGIYELLQMTPPVQNMVLARASSQEIKQVGLKGQTTLREDAIAKMKQGCTTPEEVLRVTVL